MYSLKDYLSEALIKHKISNYDNDDDAVDFGLSVKWLKYNLAGNKLTDNESDYGYYYQWGSTVGYPDATKHAFNWSTTPYIKSTSGPTFTKYVTKSTYGTVDNKTTLDPEDDAVTSLLGSKYRMPTKDEYKELCKHCTGSNNIYEEPTGTLTNTNSVSKNGIYRVGKGTIIDGVKYKNPGILFVGQDITKRIFFPAAGYYDGLNNIKQIESIYWSSSIYSNKSSASFSLLINNSIVCRENAWHRYSGLPIRGVKK